MRLISQRFAHVCTLRLHTLLFQVQLRCNPVGNVRYVGIFKVKPSSSHLSQNWGEPLAHWRVTNPNDAPYTFNLDMSEDLLRELYMYNEVIICGVQGRYNTATAKFVFNPQFELLFTSN